MKVIQKGVKPPPYSIMGRYTCRECSTVIEVEQEDVEGISWVNRGTDWVMVKCPVCERNTAFHRIFKKGSN